MKNMMFRALALTALLPCLALCNDWDKGKIQGNPSAPVAIEIFASFDCPHCRVLHETMVPQMIRDLANTGKAVIVFREFPLSGFGHEHAREAANIATAAARIGKYNEVADALFKTQAIWSQNGKIWDSISGSLAAADIAKVKALSTDPGVMGEVERDSQAAVNSGINQTPTLMVISQKNGKRFPFVGVPTIYETFRDFILKDMN
jgi:protein-disulfide isomerase